MTQEEKQRLSNNYQELRDKIKNLTMVVNQLGDELEVKERQLEKYENIEKKLGISLTTLSRLNKANYVYAYGSNGITICSLTSVNFEEVIMWNGTTCMRYPLCEYGKSFALTKEELKK